MIVVTVSDQLSDGEKSFAKKLAVNSSSGDFAGIEYGEFTIVKSSDRFIQKVILVSGIASDQLFVAEVKKRFDVLETITFEDHHRYKETDLDKISSLVKKHGDCMVLTTEKDAVKLKNKAFHKYLAEIPIFAVPIRIQMTEKDIDFLFGQITKIVKDKAYIREI